jgi:hypothetical protein
MGCFPFGNQTPSFSTLQDWELKESLWTLLQWVLSSVCFTSPPLTISTWVAYASVSDQSHPRFSYFCVWQFPSEFHMSPSLTLSTWAVHISDNFHYNFIHRIFWLTTWVYTPPNQCFRHISVLVCAGVQTSSQRSPGHCPPYVPSSRHQLLRTMQLITRVILTVT